MKSTTVKTAETAKGIIAVALSNIVTSDFNPRQNAKDDLQELADSIKQVGVLQPILVRPKGKKYEIVCGERRYRASVLADTKTIPAIIRTMMDYEALEFAVTENLQRRDISPIEEANAYKRRADTGRYDVQSLAVRFGKSDKYIRSRMKLNDLTADILDLVNRNVISMSIALEICKYGEETQAEIYEQHLQDEKISYSNWRNLTAKEFIRRLENAYCNELNKYRFDKSQCVNCPFNTACYSLFADEQENKCTNLACLREKNREYLITECKTIMQDYPDTEICAHPYQNDNGDVFAELSEQGHTVVPDVRFQFFPENPIEPRIEEFESEDEFIQAQKEYEIDVADYEEDSEEINRLLSEGKANWAVTIHNNKAVAGYIVLPENSENAEVQATANPAEKLQAQDKRNKEIAVENIVEDTRQLIRKSEIPQSDFTEMEDGFLYFAMLSDLKREHFPLFLENTQNKWLLTDEDKILIVNNLTEEQKTVIRRDFLIKHLSDTYGIAKKSYLMLEFARLHFPAEVSTTETKYNDIYNKRHERITEKLNALQEVSEVATEMVENAEALQEVA
jgi:ParB family chromosome partitioning protein